MKGLENLSAYGLTIKTQPFVASCNFTAIKLQGENQSSVKLWDQ